MTSSCDRFKWWDVWVENDCNISATSTVLGVPKSTLGDNLKKQKIEIVKEHGILPVKALSCVPIDISFDFEETANESFIRVVKYYDEEKIVVNDDNFYFTPEDDEVVFDAAKKTVSSGNEPKTREEMRVIGNIPEDWKLVDFIINNYGNNWQTKARFAPPKGQELFDITDQIIETIELASKYVEPHEEAEDKYSMVEISVADLHLAKLCWAEETGHNYDINIASNMFTDAVRDLAERSISLCGGTVKKFVLPIGNDFFHADNANNTTYAGTPLDVDSRWQKAFISAEHMILSAVEYLQKYADVEIIIVPGNHDRTRMFYFGRVLEAIFKNNHRISIDNSLSDRKYFRWGCNLIGYTHGSEEKISELPLIMASECKYDWAETTHREWHCGHYHKRKELSYVAGDSMNGVTVRHLPSLSGTDAWHHKKGYVKGIRAADCFVWDYKNGHVGTLHYNIYN